MPGRPDLAVALTSIPPRFGDLKPRLKAIMSQGPDRIFLTLPTRYQRFPNWDGALPQVPQGTAILRGKDLGPATKLIAPLRRAPRSDLVICDDDCAYLPGWLAALTAARDANPGAVIAASTFGTERLGLPKGHHIAQGFAGILIPSGSLAPALRPPDDQARWVDDIWLSAQLAAAQIPILPCPEARQFVRPEPAPCALQDADIQGKTRAGLNRQTAHQLAQTLAIWR